jgi:hypothetical protein
MLHRRLPYPNQLGKRNFEEENFEILDLVSLGQGTLKIWEF